MGNNGKGQMGFLNRIVKLKDDKDGGKKKPLGHRRGD